MTDQLAAPLACADLRAVCYSLGRRIEGDVKAGTAVARQSDFLAHIKPLSPSVDDWSGATDDSDYSGTDEAPALSDWHLLPLGP